MAAGRSEGDPMTSKLIGTGRHRLLIGEHPDNAFIASYIDGTCIGGFYDADELMDAAGELMAIARRIRKRANNLKP